MSQDSLYT